MNRILIVEDEPAILRGLCDAFEREGYAVQRASDGETGAKLGLESEVDVIILDVMLPGMSGFEICRLLREHGRKIPILMLTARGEETDRVAGLDLGADDYVTKPFSLRELLARVRALLRRTSEPPLECARFDDVELDFRAFTAIRSGSPVELTHREFSVLRALMERSNVAMTRDQILDAVVGEDVFVSSRTIDNHIVALRAKLEADPSEPKHLLTVRGVGYKWAP